MLRIAVITGSVCDSSGIGRRIDLGDPFEHVRIPQPKADLSYRSLNESEPSVMAKKYEAELRDMLDYLGS